MTTNGIHNDVIAVETHAGRIWGLFIVPGIIGLVFGVTLYPLAPGRIALIAVLVVMIGALALVLSGFQYRFLQHGVEVRTLGFRLRAIPRQSILGYSIEAWSLPRGYGIRGIGNSRAYVWGNKVVHIRTTSGEIYLGHSDPEKIVRELDQVTGFVSRG